MQWAEELSHDFFWLTTSKNNGIFSPTFGLRVNKHLVPLTVFILLSDLANIGQQVQELLKDKGKVQTNVDCNCVLQLITLESD